MVAADGTVVNDDIPRPQCDSVPLKKNNQSPVYHFLTELIRRTFLTSKRFFPSVPSEAPDFAALGAFSLLDTPEEASFISTSAIFEIFLSSSQLSGCTSGTSRGQMVVKNEGRGLGLAARAAVKPTDISI